MPGAWTPTSVVLVVLVQQSLILPCARCEEPRDVKQIIFEDITGSDYSMGGAEKSLTLMLDGDKGKETRALMSRKPVLFNKDLKIEECEKGKCQKEKVNQTVMDHLSSCTYEGKLVDDPESTVSISNCGGAMKLALLSAKANLKSTTFNQDENGQIMHNNAQFAEKEYRPPAAKDELAEKMEESLKKGDLFLGRDAVYMYEKDEEVGSDYADSHTSEQTDKPCCRLKKRTCQVITERKVECTVIKSPRRCGVECFWMKNMVAKNAKRNIKNALRRKKKKYHDKIKKKRRNNRRRRMRKKIMEELKREKDKERRPLHKALSTFAPLETTRKWQTTTPIPPLNKTTTIKQKPTTTTTTIPPLTKTTTKKQPPSTTTTTLEPSTTTEPKDEQLETFSSEEDDEDENFDTAEEDVSKEATEDEMSKSVKHQMLEELRDIVKDTENQKSEKKRRSNSHFRSQSRQKMCVGECREKEENPKKKLYDHRTIELGIATDKYLWNKMKEQVEGDDAKVKEKMLEMIHSLMTSVETFFLHKSISSQGGFKLAINGLFIWKDDSEPAVAKIHAAADQDKTLAAFADFVEERNNPYDGFTESYDIMLLLSGAHAKFGLGPGQDSGLSHVGSVCSVECPLVMSVNLEKGTHLSNAGALLAHEMGHQMGIYHDGTPGRDMVFQNCPQNKYIMTPAQVGVITEWSSCSRTQLDDEYERREKAKPNRGNCFHT